MDLHRCQVVMMTCFSERVIILINVQAIFSKPVKRADLASALGVGSDREARRVLSELQKQYNIINLQDGRGYFLADNETALRYAEQERRRALKSFNKANEMVRRCKNVDGVVVPVRAHMRRIGKRGSFVSESQVIFELEG